MFTIDRLDGTKFSEMIISGSNKLYNNRLSVNDLNVFPVPDGDTGTNMSMTASAMSRTIDAEKPKTVSKAAERMAYATLRGARGNSGVILSQLFRGMAKSLKGKNEITASELANALKAGSDAAYKAVMSPTEGTILTVARKAAEGALSKDSDDAAEVMEEAVSAGNEALRETTQMLPVLKEAGVVDAGGQGWMLILEGALEYLKTGKITESDEPEAPVQTAAQANVKTDIKFSYCTEFIAEKSDSDADVASFKETIKDKGDCMLVIDDDEVVKVHIHTNHPGFVIEEGLKIGEIISLKVENMKRQHSELIAKAQPTKETASKRKKEKDSEQLKPFGFAAVCSGRGMANILTDLGIDKIIEGGQSMNPSTQDILKAVSRVKAKTVFVFPNNKNIIMAAELAAELAENKQVIVIPSVSVPQCVRAMVDFNPQKDEKTNEKRMTKAIKEVKTGQITFAVKDTEIEGNPVKKGDILGIDEGKIRYIGADINRVLEKMLENLVDEDTEYITVYCGKDVKKQDAEKARESIEGKYADAEVSFKRGAQPLYYYIVSVE